ncbi:YesK family protein [Oceanobacillus sp. FSL K6-2867]|uniref:YesK family protein n=1 Tax=Oceanobacillus sp. FSL K6-2867 TaxID=2954748 RepID=UPI0030D72E8F
MEGFRGFIIMILIFIIVILLIALLFKEKKLLVPIIINILSVVLVVISLMFGGWEGMGLGFVSLSIYLASIIVFLIIGFRYLLNK